MAPVLLAEYGVEERKGGTGGRGGVHPAGLSELLMKFLPNRLFDPAPIKRKFDGGEAMKETWLTEKGSRRTGVTMKVDAQGRTYSQNVLRDLRLEKAVPNEGCGRTVPEKSQDKGIAWLFTPSCERQPAHIFA